MKNSIYYKILGGYLLFAILSLIAINTVISGITKKNITESEAAKLYSHAIDISNYFSEHHYNVYDDGQDFQNDVAMLFTPSNVTVWIVGLKNDVLYSSDSSFFPKEFPDIANYFHSSYYALGDLNGEIDETVLSVYAPIVYNYKTYGYVVMSSNEISMRNELVQTMNCINIAFIIIFSISMVILVIFSICIYKPLTQLITASKEYSKGNYDYQVNINSTDEMQTLADTMSFMAKSYQNMYSSQKKFIANISHDFRSPLTSINGYVTAMLDGTIPVESQERYLNIVLSETERLTKLTKGLLTLNTIDSNGMMLDCSDFDLVRIIKDTIASFEGQCGAKNLKVTFTHDDTDYIVSADQMRIQQVIYNLIDNAIKFSPNNADIIVDINEKNEKIFVSVKDFGVGISSQNQLHIWDRFYKVDDSRGKDKRGTGLGLSIVKEIITAHNENITVVSTEGVGTQFTFTLTKAGK